MKSSEQRTPETTPIFAESAAIHSEEVPAIAAESGESVAPDFADGNRESPQADLVVDEVETEPAIPGGATGDLGTEPMEFEPVVLRDESNPTEPATSESPAAAVLEPIEIALTKIDGRLDEYLRISKRKDEIINRLHAENQDLRAGELQQAQLPLIRDLMRLYDDLGRMIGDSDSGTSDLEFVCELLVDALSRNGVEREAPIDGTPFDSEVHAAVEVVAADSPDQDRTIEAIRRCGFRRTEGATLRAADVVVRRWPVEEVLESPRTQTDTEEATDSDG